MRPLTLVLLLMTGCQESARSGANAPSLRDSAGIVIAEYDAVPSGDRWVIASEPELIIGSEEGPSLFGQVGDAVGLSNSTVVIADAQARELRAFDASGTHLWTSGGRGGGPGEFGTLNQLSVIRGDTVVAADGRQVSFFDPQGKFVRRISLEPPSNEYLSVGVIGALDNGLLVGLLNRSSPPSPGRSRLPVELAVYGRSGDFLRVLGELSGNERVLFEQDGMTVQGVAPWGRRTELALGGEVIAVTLQNTFQVLHFSPDAGLATILRVASEPLLLDEDAKSRLGIQQQSIFVPDTLAAVGRLMLDSMNNLWVEEFTLPPELDPSRWWVFDSAGQFQAEVAVPRNFRMSEIGEGHVLGIATDPLGVQFVQTRRIVKSP